MPTRILYVAANPAGTDELQLAEEAAQIAKQIKANVMEVVPSLATTWDLLIKSLAEVQPHVLHFSGHGAPAGQILLEKNGQPHPINGEILAKLFAIRSDRLKLVVLNACFTTSIAKAIKKHVDCTIGTTNAVPDPVAVIFAADLYFHLSRGHSVQAAIDYAKIHLEGEGNPNHAIFDCEYAPGVDPAKVFLVPRENTSSDSDVAPQRGPAADELPQRFEDAADDRQAGNTKLNLGRLPVPADPLLVGRERIVEALTDAWKDPDTHIVQLYAIGGVGKSAILWHWLEAFQRDNAGELERVGAIDWSFYSQGQRDYVTDTRRFCEEADRHFRIGLGKDASKGDRRTGRLIGEHFRQQGGLMLLDGVEPLQYPPTTRDGAVKDPALSGLLDCLRSSPRLPGVQTPRLLVITTRWRIPDLVGKGILNIPLDNLSVEEGAELLGRFRLRGDESLRLYTVPRTDFDRECLETADEYHGHALSLMLLASYLIRCHGGNLNERHTVHNILRARDDDPYRHARRIMTAYDEALRNDPTALSKGCRQVLCLLGLFDRPAPLDLLTELLRYETMDGLNDAFVGIDFEEAVDELREIKLVVGSSRMAEEVVDTHPLIREYFTQVLQQENKAAWNSAHKHLFDYLRHSVHAAQPDRIEQLDPLFQAVIHGCKAVLHQAALHDVYLPRIMRGEQYFAANELGALSSLVSVLSHFFPPDDWSKPVVLDAAQASGLPDKDRLTVLSHAGTYLTAVRGYASEEVRQVYVHAKTRELAAHVGTTTQLIDVLYGTWRYYFVLGDLDEALRLSISMQETAKNMDFVSDMMSQRALCTTHYFRGEFQAALDAARQGSEVFQRSAEERGRGVLVGELAMAFRSYEALVFWHLGEQAAAIKLSEEAVALARTLSHEHTLAVALFLNTWLLNLCGQFEQVIERADELCDISTDNEFALWAAGGTLRRGTALLALGRRSEARADLENGIGAWRRTGARLIEPYWKVQYAKAIGDDDPATATNLIDEAMRLVEFSNERWSDTELFLTRGEICESETQDVEAANWYKKAMDSALGQSAIPYLQQSLDRLIPVWIRQEKRDDALKILQEVESRFPHHTNLLDVRTFARMCAE